ncbi:TfoX/Sxy family protein [Aurantibacter crassamenti]|uniref:TfoX/Sxy family protein n=1 Tax=Aurantibacter crassamenti TaxID=1837375 RepID=UPI001939BC59|nr:TfoX/Sxy family protein [Aurantibacter crassamenti]MBM1107669.1 TfoX/Sxy family protein [Aurantibacter crassamenti]
MAYDEYLADRARNYLKHKSVHFEEKKMMGGLCFMVDEKMCFGMHIDKNSQTSLLMARVGTDQYENALSKPHCTEMNFTGRTMKGYVFVTEEGIDTDVDLEFWLQLCIDFNPFAKSSKKRTSKKK